MSLSRSVGQGQQAMFPRLPGIPAPRLEKKKMMMKKKMVMMKKKMMNMMMNNEKDAFLIEGQ
jgi:hypothetical protein